MFLYKKGYIMLQSSSEKKPDITLSFPLFFYLFTFKSVNILKQLLTLLYL